MDVSAVGAYAATLIPVTSGPTPAGASGVFDASFASALDAELSAGPGLRTADAAERLVGSRPTPPVGGCQCDAMAAAVLPDGAAGSGTVTGQVVAQRSAVQPGDVLLLAGPTLADRLHLAIVSNTFQMIAPGDDGVVGTTAIPWDRVRDVRRTG